MRMFRVLAAAWSLPLCAMAQQTEERWDGSIRQWGTMQEVLKAGRTEARVDIRKVAEPNGAVGIGALEGLRGEVTFVDGRVWLAAHAKGSKGELPASVHDSATLLTVAYVPNWVRISISEEVLPHDFDGFLREAARKAGVDIRRPFPFVVEGRMSVEAHVIRGQCAHAGAGATEPAIPPDRFSRAHAQATLVGFYAGGAEGALTHHGSATHVHVVIHGEPPLSGHVDSVTIVAGAVLRLPAGN